MKIVALILLIALPARAAGPLAFSGRIQNEALAEEAIDLLHCLADELEISWELSEESKAAFSLRLEEKGNNLEGFFQTPEGRKTIRMGRGEANKICAELTSAEEKTASPVELPAESWEPEKSKPRWLWIAGAAALVAGGFFLWKSRPDHRSLRME